jgi:hypothetical protein
MPVLAIGGAASFGENVGNAMKLVADDVHSVVIPDTGHFLAEESPDELLAALTPFASTVALPHCADSDTDRRGRAHDCFVAGRARAKQPVPRVGETVAQLVGTPVALVGGPQPLGQRDVRLRELERCSPSSDFAASAIRANSRDERARGIRTARLTS